MESWSRPPPPLEDFEAILQDIGRAKPVMEMDMEWKGSELKAKAKSMRHQASGPDDWRPSDLARLPEMWFDELAVLWAKAWNTGVVPCQWQRARCPKADGSWRPLSLASVAWRLGAGLIVKQLRGWVELWASPHRLGGLHDRCVQHAHMRVHESDPERIFIAEDFLSKCFDTIEIQQACSALDYHGAPRQFVRLVKGFYFLLQAGAHSAWTVASARRGMKLVAECYNVVPCRRSSRQHCFSAGCGRWLAVAEKASMQLSMLTTELCGHKAPQPLELPPCWPPCAEANALTRHADGSVDHPCDCAELRQEFPHPQVEELGVLGVCHRRDVSCTPSKASLPELSLRARLVRALRMPVKLRTHLLEMLIVAKLRWIACVTCDFKEPLDRLRTDVTWALADNAALREAPSV